MNPTYDFQGQVALVTGASSGMGLATAQAFAEAGAAVVLADINEKPLRAATDDLTAAGHQAIAVTCDVSDEEQVAATIERAVDQFGSLDLAFNNAGIQAPPADAADEPAEFFTGHYHRVGAVELWRPFYFAGGRTRPGRGRPALPNIGTHGKAIHISRRRLEQPDPPTLGQGGASKAQ